MTTSQFLLPPAILLILAAATLLSGLAAAAAAAAEEQFPIARPYCRDKCGNISIPFPFGIGPGCFFAGQFEVLCNDSTTPPRAYLVIDTVNDALYHLTGKATLSAGAEFPFNFNQSAIPRSPIELMDISLAKHEVRAYGTVSSYCTKSSAEQVLRVQMTNVAPIKTTWLLALSKRNLLVGVGKEVEVRLVTHLYMDVPSTDEWLSAHCASSISVDDFSSPINGSCAGSGCCQIPFSGGDETYVVHDTKYWDTLIPEEKDTPCSYGMMVESLWYNFSTPDMYGYQTLSKKLHRGVPFVIDFAIVNQDQLAGGNGSCPAAGQQPPPGYACASSNSFCTNTSTESLSSVYVCECSLYYEGNPYITNGCQDIDECKKPDLYPCHGDCKTGLEATTVHASAE